MFDFSHHCLGCKARFPSDRVLYSCPACGGTLHVDFNFSGREEEARQLLRAAPDARGMWRYAAFLPVSPATPPVTLGEGDTPLVRAPNLGRALGLKNLWLKNESLNPSGTFKDRCMAVAYTKTREAGGKGMILGSAGNAAAAASAYAARGGMPCYVLVPESTPRERVVHNLLYGARVILVKGTVNDCIDMASEVMNGLKLHNATTAAAHNPYQAEGPKTIAYETARQLDWLAPDWVLTPIGGGGILTSMWRGFSDALTLGLIQKIPKMAGVQALGCSAVFNAFRDGKKPGEIVRVPAPKTIAVAIADPLPLDGKTALTAIYASGGASAGLEDGEILAAQALLARSEGVIADPASSCTIGGIGHLVRQGRIKPEETVVAVITGTGLKDLRLAGESIAPPPVIEKDVAALLAAIDNL